MNSTDMTSTDPVHPGPEQDEAPLAMAVFDTDRPGCLYTPGSGEE
ncbi:hypothetical protein [Actinomadura rubrisoli]|nr:hypothetical protein [Actinomadura rubrisoli]